MWLLLLLRKLLLLVLLLPEQELPSEALRAALLLGLPFHREVAQRARPEQRLVLEGRSDLRRFLELPPPPRRSGLLEGFWAQGLVKHHWPRSAHVATALHPLLALSSH